MMVVCCLFNIIKRYQYFIASFIQIVHIVNTDMCVGSFYPYFSPEIEQREI